MDTNDIVIPSRADAEVVLDALYKLAEKYEFVTLSDYLDLVGLSPTFTDRKIGWTRLNDIKIANIKDGYVIMLPDPQPVGISVARTAEDAEKEAKRIALIKVMKAEKERGYSNSALAQKHNLSESTVRSMLGLDIYTITFVQLGTDRRTTIDIAAPAGMEYDDVVAKFKRDLS